MNELVDSFNLLLTREIIQLVLVYTNLEGSQNVSNWTDIDLTDLEAYIGLLLLAGVYRSRKESTHSLWDAEAGRPMFRATMSHERFQKIHKCLRFDDKLSRRRRAREDKFAAFRDLWEMWTARLPLLYNPGRDVCVDEQLVPF